MGGGVRLRFMIQKWGKKLVVYLFIFLLFGTRLFWECSS